MLQFLPIHLPLTLTDATTTKVSSTSSQDDTLFMILTTLIILLVYQILPWSKLSAIIESKWRIYRSYRVQKYLERAKSALAQDNDESIPTVSGLYVYPVKSLRAVSISTSKIDSLGLQYDRRFMIVRPIPPSPFEINPPKITHRFFTQRQAPILATISTTLPDTKNGKITLSHKATNTQISFPTSVDHILSRPNRYHAGIWDDSVEVADMGDEVAQFLQNILKLDPNHSDDNPPENIRLVALLPTTHRYTEKRYIPPVGYLNGKSPLVSLTDGFPILIASETSLEELNTHLQKKISNHHSHESISSQYCSEGCSKTL